LELDAAGTYHLVSQHQDCLELELPLAVVEQVFQGWAQEVDNHDVVVTFDSEPVDVWDSNTTLKDSIELGFIEQLWVLGSYGFQFNGDFFVGSNVSAMVDVTEGTAT